MMTTEVETCSSSNKLLLLLIVCDTSISYGDGYFNTNAQQDAKIEDHKIM
jgi:hypothetical protein